MALPVEDRPPIPTVPGPLTEFIRSLDTPQSDDLPPEVRALLEVIAGTESAGNYNVIYGGSTFDDYGSHPLKYVEIGSGPNKGKKSSAAGKYQFLGSTWNQAKKALDLPDFSPQSQDKAAWWLAEKRYQRDTGRNLLTDLRAGGDQNMRRISGSLRKEWTSLPGGIEQGQSQSRFASTYNRVLANGPRPPAGMASDPPAPQTMSAMTAFKRGLEPTPGPTPRPRVEMEVAKNRTMPFLGTLPDVQRRPATPPPSLIADAVRSPTLFGDTIAIPDDMMSTRPDGSLDPSYRLYGPDNRMSVGGLGSLLGGRTIPPAMPNSPSVRPTTSPPGFGLSSAQRTAMAALPSVPSVPTVGGVGGANIAGQVQLPRDVVPASVQRDLAAINALPSLPSPFDTIGAFPSALSLAQMRTTGRAPIPMPTISRSGSPFPASYAQMQSARSRYAAPTPASRRSAVAPIPASRLVAPVPMPRPSSRISNNPELQAVHDYVMGTGGSLSS